MYHLQIKPISRSDGRTATAAAAYRSATLITDERTGEVHDYGRKGGVEHREIVLPAVAPAWADDRAALWNAAEAAEKRKDARVAREYEVAIPKELTKLQGIALVRDFASELVERHGVAVDFNIHEDDHRRWDGSIKGWRSYHAHVMASTRQLGPDGFGAKAHVELGDKDRKARGLSSGAAEIALIRERWEVIANRHLQRAGQDARIDRRSLKDQGIDREPTVHLGPEVTALERRGVTSRLGDINRRVTAERQDAHELDAEIAELEQAAVRRVADVAEQARVAPILDKPKVARPRIDLSALDRDDEGGLKRERLAAEESSRQEQKGREKKKQELKGRQPAAELVRAPAEAEENPQRVKREGDKQQEPVLTPAAREEARVALEAAMAQQVLERTKRVYEVLKLAAAREARRQRELEFLVQNEPQAPNLAAAPWAQKGYEELCKTWERSRAALAKLVEQAKQLAERLLDAAQPERLVKWAQGYLMRERPDLVEPYARVQKAEKEEKAAAERIEVEGQVARPKVLPVSEAPSRQGEQERAGSPAGPLSSRRQAEPGVEVPKRDWNRHKQLQQELAAKGRQSLQERGVLRDPSEPEPKPREHEREIKPPSKGQSR